MSKCHQILLDLKTITCFTGESNKTGHFYSFTDVHNTFEILHAFFRKFGAETFNILRAHIFVP